MHQKEIREIFILDSIKSYAQPVWVYDLNNYKFVAVNDSVTRMYGYSENDFLNLTLNDILHPDNINNVPSLVSNYSEYFTQHVLRSGEILQVEIFVNIVSSQGRKLAVEHIRDITLQMQTIQSLKSKEFLFEEVGKMAKVGGWEMDPDTMIGTGTKELANIYDLDDMKNVSLEKGAEFLLHDSRNKLLDSIMDLIRTGKEYDLKLEMISAKNRHKWIRVIGKPVYMKLKLVKVRGIIQDITEQKLLEEKLLKNKARLKEAQRIAKIGSWEISTGTQSGYWSDELYNIFSLTPADAPPSFEEYLKFVHPEDREKLKSVFQSYESGITPPVYEFRTNPDLGTVKYLLPTYSAIRDEEGNITKYIGTVQDITQLKIKENELILKTEELDYYFNNSLELFSIININGIFERVNLQWKNIFGYEPDELIGKQSFDLVHPDDQESSRTALKFLLENKNLIDFVNRVRRKDGTYRKIEWRTHVKSDLLYAVARDITNREEMIEELRSAKVHAEAANKLKDNFIATISHEIRTPLNGILGLISLVKDEFSEKINPDIEKLFSGISLASKRIIRTVDMILNYSRLKSGLFTINNTVINLAVICSNLITEYSFHAASKNINLVYKNLAQDPEIFADEYCITEAISNLIDNAIKYTRKGSVSVTIKENQDAYLVEIKDTGIGMSKDYIKHLFEPYRQEDMGYGRAYDGIGLGLSLVNQLLRLNNAALECSSVKDSGTKFIITFLKGK